MTAVLKVVAGALLGVVALATHGFGIAGGDPGPRTVEITIHHSRFTPAVVDVKAGTTVRFVVHNTDFIDHELIIGDRTVQDAHEVGREAHHARPGEVTAPAEQTVETTYTFPATASGTTTLFGCHLPGHYAYGMQGLIHIK